MEPTVIAAIAAVAVVIVILLVVRARRGQPPEAPEQEEREQLESGEQRLDEMAQAKASSSEAAAEATREAERPPPEAEAEARAERPAQEEAREEPRPAEPSEAAEAEPSEAAEAEPAEEPATAEPSPPAAETEERPSVQPATPAPKQRSTDEEVAELKKGLSSTRGGFISRLARLFGKKKELDADLLEQIEEVLVTADLGMKTTERLLERLKERMQSGELTDSDQVWTALREEAVAILGGGTGGVAVDQKPTVILVVGVNGTGKTTTIGKLASRFAHEGKSVILGAGDTFRAAAVLQLEVWGRKVGCEVVKGKERADPASVLFDTVKKGVDEGADIVIADTAGRLHTKAPLMEELKKVGRTVEKALGRPADEVLLVLDSTTGQNAIQQAQMFRDALPITGIVLTKLDGTAKGGVILGIVDEHGLPVRYIGIGERVEDLREFDAESFAKALFAKPDDETMAA